MWYEAYPVAMPRDMAPQALSKQPAASRPSGSSVADELELQKPAPNDAILIVEIEKATRSLKRDDLAGRAACCGACSGSGRSGAVRGTWRCGPWRFKTGRS